MTEIMPVPRLLSFTVLPAESFGRSFLCAAVKDFPVLCISTAFVVYGVVW